MDPFHYSLGYYCWNFASQALGPCSANLTHRDKTDHLCYSIFSAGIFLQSIYRLKLSIWKKNRMKMPTLFVYLMPNPAVGPQLPGEATLEGFLPRKFRQSLPAPHRWSDPPGRLTRVPQALNIPPIHRDLPGHRRKAQRSPARRSQSSPHHHRDRSQLRAWNQTAFVNFSGHVDERGHVNDTIQVTRKCIYFGYGLRI